MKRYPDSLIFTTMSLVAATVLGMPAGNAQPVGDSPMPLQPEVEFLEDEDRPPLLEAKMDFSYNAGGETEFRDSEYGDSDAISFNFSAGTMLPLNESWMLPLELKLNYLALDDLSGVPMPDSIQTLEYSIGIAWKPNDRWMFMANITPTLYKLEDIESDDFGVSGGLMAEWQYNDAWKWTFGIMVQPDNDLPVIPLVGFEWQINDHWKLRFPFSPRLTYSPDDKWSYHIGVDMILGTTFRTSDDLGSELGLPEFDGEIGSYSDFRIGGGVGYKLNESFSMEFEAGYSVNREIEYSDIDETVKFDPAPYFRVGLKYEF